MSRLMLGLDDPTRPPRKAMEAGSDAGLPTGGDLLLGVVGALATALAVAVVAVAGDFALWMAVVGAGATVAVLLRRDSLHGLVALGALALMWLAASPPALSPWSIVLALLMFTAHVSLALRTTAPPGARFGRAIVVLWLRRSGAVGVLTGLVFLLAMALHHLHQSDAEAVLAAALVLLGGLILLLRRETLDAEGGISRDWSP